MKARRVRDGLGARGCAALLGVWQWKSRADIQTNFQRGGVYSSANSNGVYHGERYYLVQKHLFARLKI